MLEMETILSLTLECSGQWRGHVELIHIITDLEVMLVLSKERKFSASVVIT